MKNGLMVILVFAALASGCSQEESKSSSAGISQLQEITLEELSMHSTGDDCWIVYEGNVYNFTGAANHPDMENMFFTHCGKESGFEEAAKARHAQSSEERVQNFGKIIGVLGK